METVHPYTKLKVVELKQLLAARHLPRTGNRAELIQRLEDADRTAAGAAANPMNIPGTILENGVPHFPLPTETATSTSHSFSGTKCPTDANFRSSNANSCPISTTSRSSSSNTSTTTHCTPSNSGNSSDDCANAWIWIWTSTATIGCYARG